LHGEELRDLADQLSGWKVIEERYIQKSYLFPDFLTALDFVNRVAALAEEQGHHPDLTLSWGQVLVSIFTHKVRGLTESDFILGAKIDALRFR
jgi:4a-hydroxytetrahydrobiopterin dehydratase